MKLKGILKRVGIGIGATILTSGMIFSQAGIVRAADNEVEIKPISSTPIDDLGGDITNSTYTNGNDNKGKKEESNVTNKDFSVEDKNTNTEETIKKEPQAKNLDKKGEKSFNEKDGNINVYVKAPEGALPDGTTMRIRPLKGVELENFKEDVAKEGNKIVYSGQAVDISFYNKEGKEIEPEKEIDVKISLDYSLPLGEQLVAHKKDNGEVNLVENAKATQNTTYFKSKEFSVYGTVTAGWVGGLVGYNDGSATLHYYKLQYNGKNAYCLDWGKDMPNGSSYTEKDILDVMSLEQAKNLCALIYKYRERVGHQGSYYEIQALIWSYLSGKRICI